MEESSTFFRGHDTLVKNVNGASSCKIYNYSRVSDTILGEYSSIGDFSTVRESKLGERSSIQRNCDIWRLDMDRYSCVGRMSTIQSTKIGAFCALSWNLRIGGDDHDYKMISTHPFWHNVSWGIAEDKEYSRMYHEKEYEEPCIIGNDVWIGAGVSICRNVHIGNGCVIGAGAVITHDLEPYSIVVGVPGKVIKKRFKDSFIERLEKMQWWNLPINVIKENISLFRDSKLTDTSLSRLEALCNEKMDFSCITKS